MEFLRKTKTYQNLPTYLANLSHLTEARPQIINSEQHGFRAGFSTVTFFVHFNIDARKHVLGFFFGLVN